MRRFTAVIARERAVKSTKTPLQADIGNVELDVSAGKVVPVDINLEQGFCLDVDDCTPTMVEATEP